MTPSLTASLFLGCSEAPPPCEPTIDAWADEDGDGYGGASLGKVCELEKGQVDRPYDCDDQDELLSPDHVEGCDGIDNDCDGHVDEDTKGLEQWWYDGDGDGFGALYPSQLACDKPGPEWVANADDCRDGDPAVNPDAQEVCGRIDEDCDGYIDESDDSVDPSTFSVFYADTDGDGYGDRDNTIERCRLIPGYVLAGNDCDDTDPQLTQNDYWVDADDDGYGDPAQLVAGCRTPPAGTVANDEDCDDGDPTINVETDWFDDLDGDGWGSGPSLAFQCTAPDPYLVPQDGDCDEADPLHNPGTPEVCDDGLDQNCNLIFDCEDDACLGDPVCPPPCVDEVLDPTPPISDSGSTVGQGNDFAPTCGASNASDYAFAFTASATRTYTFNTIGSGYDTVLAIFSDCGGVQLGCNDDWYGLQSRVQVFLTAGQTVIVDVDGYSSSQGNFVLNVL